MYWLPAHIELHHKLVEIYCQNYLFNPLKLISDTVEFSNAVMLQLKAISEVDLR